MKRFLLAFGAGLLAVGCVSTSKPPPTPRTRRVVLVHGFLENGCNYKLLKQRLEGDGIQCLVPKLVPCDGRGGLEHLAAGLKQDIDTAYGPDQPIAIVGFSMGGLVARYYLQNLGGAARCDQLITVSTPHHGTDSANYYPSLGAQQMRLGSRFLADLEKTENKLGHMRLVSYRSRYDMVIYPHASAIWDRAENLEFSVLFHSMMVTSGAVMSDIERRLVK